MCFQQSSVGLKSIADTCCRHQLSEFPLLKPHSSALKQPLHRDTLAPEKVQTPAWPFRICFFMAFLESDCSQQCTHLHLFLHIPVLLIHGFMSCGNKELCSSTVCEGTVKREEEMRECSIRTGICCWNKALFDVRWHMFASILGLISLSGKGVVCWCFWNECYINNKVAQAATKLRKLPTVWKEWLAKRSIDDEQAAGGEPGFLSFILQVCRKQRMLSQKKNEIILNKWYFSGCIACKDVSLLNYFAVLTVQLYKKGKKNCCLQGLYVINFPVELFLPSQGLIKVGSNRKHL